MSSQNLRITETMDGSSCAEMSGSSRTYAGLRLRSQIIEVSAQDVESRRVFFSPTEAGCS